MVELPELVERTRGLISRDSRPQRLVEEFATLTTLLLRNSSAAKSTPPSLRVFSEATYAFRRDVVAMATRFRRYIATCRVMGYAARPAAKVADNDLSKWCNFDVCAATTEGEEGEEFVRYLRRAMAQLARWVLTRVVPVRAVLENVGRLRDELEAAREARRNEIARAASRDVICDDAVPTAHSQWRSGRVRDVELTISALEERIRHLSELLTRAPATAQIKVAHTMDALRREFELRELEMLRVARSSAEAGLADVAFLAAANVKLDRMFGAVARIRRIGEDVNRLFSREIKELTIRVADLKLYNDSLASANKDDERRVVQMVRLESQRVGSSVLESLELNYISEVRFPNIAMPPSRLSKELSLICERVCDGILNATGGVAATMEARANRARDALVAFLYRHGDALFLRYARRVLLRDTAWRQGATIAAPEDDDGNLRARAQLFRERTDWPGLSHVPSSVLRTVLELFEIRRERLSRRAADGSSKSPSEK